LYNAEGYLAEAIESILAQTYPVLEIIIIDDGSSDHSAQIAQNFGDKIIYKFQTNRGAASARNLGIELARGNFLAFLDADDLWEVDKLNLQVAAFTNEPNLDIVFGQVRHFYSPELEERNKIKIHCPSELMAGYYPGTMLIKKNSFHRVGMFETNWQVGEFISWYGKAKDLNMQIKMLPNLVMQRRLHTSNQGIYKKNAIGDYARLLKHTLDRRRIK
jgi:glycosyltransferase involved in cell wall biosynthesis